MLQFLSGFGFSAVIFYIVFRNPEKVQKWLSMFAWLLTYIWKKSDYFAIKSELQGKINSFVRNIEDNTTGYFPQIKIKWTAKGNEEIIWEDYEIIMVMRDKKYQNKNFVHAAYFFTSEVLLKHSKKHVSKTQKTSLDLFATKKLLELENNSAVDQFMEDYFVPEIEKSEKVKDLIRQYVSIDQIGVFFPILIQELSNLGKKVFLEKQSTEMIEEVKMLIDFLEKFSQREVGDTTIPDEFMGKYTKCAIKIVASKWTRSNVTNHKKRLDETINKTIENIYILGSNVSENRDLIDGIIELCCAEHKDVYFVKKWSVRGKIKIKGKYINVTTYLVQIKNRGFIRYIFEED